jgi:ribonuclease R
MINKKKIIISLYTEKLYGKSIDEVCTKLSKMFRANKHEIENILEVLSYNGEISIENGKVTNSFSAKKQNNQLETPLKKASFNLDGRNLVLGTIQKEDGIFVFKASKGDLPTIPIPATDDVKNALGQRCCCDVALKGKYYVANLMQVFGELDDPISENVAIAYKYGFEKQFSKEVLDEVKQIPQTVTEKDFEGREDMTGIYFMPWDPATCKDKDDAIYAEKTENGYKVYVAIADVSHYVKPNTALDNEAFKRGTSCYLGSGVYPMLPPELSNGICSLNDGTPRLALVSVIDIDKKGKILDYEFKKAVINIKQSFCYEDVEKVHLCQDGFDEKYATAKPYVDVVYEVADVLENKLDNRGAINFINYEPEFKFNAEKNEVEDVSVTGSERSHKVVEEFMILANEATAQFFGDFLVDGIYRNHKKPNEAKMQDANNNLKKFGVMETLANDSKSYQKVLNSLNGTPSNEYLNSVILRSMARANYEAENNGHFGLASTGYTHFTSPIRRYSDTIAHRIISNVLECGKSSISKSDIEYITNHLNDQEFAATQAERESDGYLCCLWAEKHKNEVFEGYITSIYPACVNIRRKGVEIQVPTHLLENGANANYVLSEDMQTIKDKNSNAKYSVGQTVKFRICDIDKSNHTITGSLDLEKTFEDCEEDSL